MKGFFNTIILLGALQGLIVSVLLFRRKGNKLPDRLLAWLLLLMAMASFNLYFYNTGFFDSTATLRVVAAIIPLVITMPMGPLIYFYIRANLDPGFILKKQHRLQFYTGVIDVVPQATAIVFIAGLYLGFFQPGAAQWVGIFIDDYNKYADIPRWLSITIYVWLSFRYIQKEKASVANTEPARTARIKWLKQFISLFLIFQVIWFIYLIPYIHPVYSDWLLDLVWWYPIYIPLAIMIYWLGLKGYLFPFPAGEKKKRIAADLSPSLIAETKDALTRSMEKDKLYLKQYLNLDIVASHTGVAAKTISAVLNQHLQKSFNEWVNAYRIDEFKQRIGMGALGQLTISAIAFECGFNSQPTFQRTFKQMTGMTPTEYLKSVGSSGTNSR